MKSITFGPVTHEGKSYAYALGYGAYQMGHARGYNPYHIKSQQKAWDDFSEGYARSVADVKVKLEDFINSNKEWTA
ncbi:hypothetical protein DRQ25_18305 [Candidatus Fermentibacteria bacterium]|nr:MAG: hypothetical protein DRQ25_18305 [Candidatus Fermentibacteria bacterium]